MGLGVSLVLVAAGAILVWGVTSEPSGLDLDAIGVILMVIGIVGFVLSMILWRSWWGPGLLHALDLRRGRRSDGPPDNLCRRRAAAATRRRPAPAAVGALKRCGWVPEQDPLYVAYHDEEWGVPSHDDRHLFELLVLEGAQAGLSWKTILNKRDGYKKAFAGFDPQAVARFGARDVKRLVGDAGIVRHKGKIEAAIANAQAVLAVQEELGQLRCLRVELRRRLAEKEPLPHPGRPPCRNRRVCAR